MGLHLATAVVVVTVEVVATVGAVVVVVVEDAMEAEGKDF